MQQNIHKKISKINIMSISCSIKHLSDGAGNMCKKDTGLGNTLFQLATQYAFSKKYNITMNVYELVLYSYILKHYNYDHEDTIFRKLLSNYNKEEPKDCLVISEEHDNGEVCDKGVLTNISNQSNTTSNVKISGYFQSFLYFDEYRSDIVDMFEPDKRSYSSILSKYPILFNDDYTCISIHIRMNYANCINYNYNFFEEAIKKVSENQDKKLHFFIFSNNVDSINGWFVNKNLHYTIVKDNIDYYDLWVMSLCKHNIISHSTFAWWGAYLNNNPDKIVIYPKDSLRIWWGELHNNIIKPEREYEHFMPNWICLDVQTLEKYN
jgi:hypothetical protein